MRWVVATAGFMFVEGHIVVVCALKRCVSGLRDEVKSMVVGHSHGEVRALINIPFDAVLQGRLQTHGCADLSSTFVWCEMVQIEEKFTYLSGAFILSGLDSCLFYALLFPSRRL
jgi:hypothetical protein